MIPEELLEQIRVQTNIVDIVSEFVDLNNQYKAPCPFLDHLDNAPSFSVSPAKQIFKCFGCQKGGNVFTFLMLYKGFTFVQAVKYCADRVGIVLKYDSDSILDKVIDVNEEVARIFNESLGEKNLFKQRGLSQAVIDRYQLGICNNESLYQDLGSTYSNAILEQSCIFKKDSTVPRFLNKFVFPFHDITGKVIGFAGTSQDASPKYINSPDYDLYHKSRYLYGIYQAIEHIRKLDCVIVVEGYFDVLSLVDAGYCNVVAVCGSAFTEQQAKLLNRYTDNILLCFDGDSAGKKALKGSISSLFNYTSNIYVLSLPEGEDPDSYVASNDFKDIINTAELWFDKELSYSTTQQKLGRIQTVKEIASDIIDDSRRVLFFELCAEKLNISAESLYGKKYHRQVVTIPEIVKNNSVEILFLSCLFYNPENMREDFREVFNNDVLQLMFYRVFYSKGDVAKLYNEVEEKYLDIVNEIVENRVNGELLESLYRRIQLRNINKEIDKVQLDIKWAEEQANDCSDLIERLNSLIEERRELQ